MIDGQMFPEINQAVLLEHTSCVSESVITLTIGMVGRSLSTLRYRYIESKRALPWIYYHQKQKYIGRKANSADLAQTASFGLI